MNKYCSNCGKEINENAVICVNCGVATNNLASTKQKQPGKGLSIASMVLGIIAIFYGFWSILMCAMIFSIDEFYYFEERIIFSVVFNFLPLVLSITGISLGLASLSKIKNGMNTAGIILNAITVLICIISIFLIIIM